LSFYFQEIEISTVSGRPSYYLITQDIDKIIERSGVENGICLVQTYHTTCSVYFDEYMHDKNYYGDDYLQVDLNHILDRLVPKQSTENYPYLSPGPKHIAYGMKKIDPNYPAVKWTMLNTDAHLRSDFLGSSVTLGVKGGQLLTGPVGQIFFVDFDQTRERDRKIQVIVLGDEEDDG
jgi:thiamine phosphate synthase YjbQ (UPF0047 family)